MPYMIENMKDSLRNSVSYNLKISVTELGTHHSLNRYAPVLKKLILKKEKNNLNDCVS